MDDTKALLSEVNRFLETIGSYEQEMKRMAKDANDYDQKERSLRRDAIKLKEEFDNLKKQYDKESPEKEAALKAQKAIVAKKGEGISPELLARYHEIKKRITPPLARLINNQCSGCNMSLPSAVRTVQPFGSLMSMGASPAFTMGSMVNTRPGTSTMPVPGSDTWLTNGSSWKSNPMPWPVTRSASSRRWWWPGPSRSKTV